MPSEDPIRENEPTPHSEGKPDIQASDSKPNIPPSVGVPGLPPAHGHYKITCKTERNWWDKFKPFVEIFGVLLLAAYSGYTIMMYYANKEAADAAKNAANIAAATLKFTVESSRLDQRAWVGIQTIDLSPVEEGKQLRADINIQNTGKTFGLKVIDRGYIIISDRPLLDGNRAMEMGLISGNQTTDSPIPVFPNAKYGFHLTCAAPLTAKQIDAINSGKETVYLVGDINYDDVFGAHHFTNYFARYNTALKAFEPQNGHNDAN